MRLRLTLAALCATASLAACSDPVQLLYAQTLESPSYSNPLVTKDLVIFGSDSGAVYAYSKDGNRRWVFDKGMRAVEAAPDWDGNNTIYFGSTNQFFYALSADQGQLLWKFETQDRIKGDPTWANGTVYFGSYDKHLYALDGATGKLKWMFPAPPAPPPAPAPAKVEPAKGKKGAKAKKVEPAPVAAPQPPPAPPAPPIETGEFSYSKPLVVNNTVYVGNLDGCLYAVDAQTGVMKWRFKTGKGTEGAGIGITSSPAFHDGVIFFGSNDHNVYALSEDGTKVIWTFKTGDQVISSPKISDGLVFVGGVDHNFYAIDEKTGAEKWHVTGNGPFISSPAFHGNYVVMCGGPGDGTIGLYEKATGKLAWSYKTGYQVKSDPTVVGDAIFVTAGDSRLYAFQINAK